MGSAGAAVLLVWAVIHGSPAGNVAWAGPDSPIDPTPGATTVQRQGTAALPVQDQQQQAQAKGTPPVSINGEVPAVNAPAATPSVLPPSVLDETAILPPLSSEPSAALPQNTTADLPVVVPVPAPSDLVDLAVIPTPGPVTGPDAAVNGIAIIRNEKVEGHMRFFHTAIRDRFEQWLTRLSQYKPLVDRIFSEFDLPSDLVFLSLVESGFNPHAYSRARATGPWQFMKGTAQVYGLRVDQYVDERRDPIKSTVAAARYLRDLHDLFGTWPLAMAAYNAGEGKVQRALQKARADNFWDIAATKHIRRETKEYVPRFMAATIIARNPDQFGFTPTPTDPHDFEEVAVHHAVHFRDLEKTTGIPYSEFQRLNPELRRDVTPPDDAVYHLKVPVGMKLRVEQVLDQIPTWKPTLKMPKLAKHRAEPVESSGWYRVRAGDSLWTIAKRFHVSVQDLKDRNNLSGRRLRPGELLAISR